ncbi:MAG: hypothetical protein Q9170_006239 [Blastenia crenularia]
MTTAHRPTFDPARGKEAQRGVAYHQRLLPAHKQLKTRQPGQGGDADTQPKDLRAQLLDAEAAHFSKINGTATKPPPSADSVQSSKRQLEAGPGQDGEVEEDIEAKRRRVLEETRHIDADSDGSSNASSDEDRYCSKPAPRTQRLANCCSDDEEDETAELLRELEKIKKERAERQAQEDRAKAEAEQEDRERDIALGNPLLNPSKNNDSKRKWDDDVVFRNQARGTENKGKKEFVNVRHIIDRRATPARTNYLDAGSFTLRLSQAVHAVGSMAMFAHQIWTLVKKDLLIAAARRPISTTIRALLLPLAIVLIISYAQYFFNPPQHFGVGETSPILSLSNAIAGSSGGRTNIAFVDNGLKGGEIASIIDDVATSFRKAGKSIHNLTQESDLLKTCASSQRGTTSCFGAVVFHSSPTEPVKGGVWNYTIRSDTSLGHYFNVKSPNNDAQVYLLPLQRTIDLAIAARMEPPMQNALQVIRQYIYTQESEEKRETDTRRSYFSAGIAFFGVIYFLGMVGVVYQMTGLIATERERGLTQLIDAMMPQSHRWQPQLARVFAHHTAFSIIYLPSWLATGIVLASVVFVKSAAAITICYHLMAGLALCSYALVGGAFFKKAQLSGIIMIVITVVLAVIPQVLSPSKQTLATVVALSLIFPSSNYTYFITSMARWEYENLPTNVSKIAPGSPWKLTGLILWVFLIIQIFVYPLLAVVIEQFLFSTASSNRKMLSHNDKSAATVQLRGFSKSYRQHWLLRIFWKSKADVHAVKGLSLDAHKGQILMLLGPNGSGKSTTLDAIAGLSKVTSGRIDIDGNGGLGIAPQNNVLWDDFTAEEHVKLMYGLKAANTRNIGEHSTTLIEACDLTRKTKAKAKTLSGGQKRKLQLAMMFAGGSTVCCIDEVSSGLDPLSRRKIWDILLAERGERTIIMTTHFLDEADFLSDHIAILSTGHLIAEGSSAGLKHRYGEGYKIHVPAGRTGPFIHGVDRKESSNGTTYASHDPASTTRSIDALGKAGIDDFRVSGPTLEDVFLKVAGSPLDRGTSQEDHHVSITKEKPRDNAETVISFAPRVDLHNGRQITPWRQAWLLYRKRWMVFRRNYFPMLFAIATALIGAGVCPIFLKWTKAMECGIQADNAYTPAYPSYVQSLAQDYGLAFVGGPSAKITGMTLAGLADIYSQDHTEDGSGTIDSVSTLRSFITPASTYQDFSEQIALGNATITPGGFWLGGDTSTPVFAWLADPYNFGNALELQNVVNNMLIGGRITTSFSEFDIPDEPIVYDYAVLIFIIYYALVLCLYPGLYALYPTVERLRNVRAMQYSNGVRSLPLWLAYIMFDLGFTLIISIISTVLFSVGTRLCSSILSYIISMFASSQLAAWAFCTSGQFVFCLGYFGAYIGVQSNVPIGDLISTLNKVHYTIGLVSPVANVIRALFISLNQFSLLCGDTSSPGAIELYGGPILYLILQIFLFFGILIWWDSGVSLISLGARKHKKPAFEMEGAAPNAASKDVADEIKRVKEDISAEGLRVLHLSKSFGKTKAVDDVTFGVDGGEVFALLGPNGAGKSK